MSELPFMPFYVDVFDGNTTHLNLEEDGCYNRLLRLLWRNPGCSIPDDASWIARRLRIDQETYYRVAAPIIDEYCSRKNGKIYQKRLMSEWLKAKDKIEKRKEAGKKGGEAKALKEKEIEAGKGTDLPKHIHKHLHQEKDKHSFDGENPSYGTDPAERSEQSVIDIQKRLKKRGY